MELFTKFKLKVAEAEAQGYDTVPKLKRELEGYRKQLALHYLIDSVANQAMVNEAYERLKTEIRASHILIRMGSSASPEDTLKAFNRLLELKDRIEKGEDFGRVARSKNSSQDPSVKDNGGDLGYFTAFQMVFPFEDMAYKTSKGEVSIPFRTKFGYHILQVTDTRPARGTVKVAHLMVATPQGTSAQEMNSAEKKINENIKSFKNSFKSFSPIICFSTKSNCNLEILKLIKRSGLGADVVSKGELMIALKAGITSKKIVFSGVGKTRSELIYAIDKNILLINCESKSEILEIESIAKSKNKKVNIGIRLNPNTDAKTIKQISTGKKENKSVSYTHLRAHET